MRSLCRQRCTVRWRMCRSRSRSSTRPRRTLSGAVAHSRSTSRFPCPRSSGLPGTHHTTSNGDEPNGLAIRDYTRCCSFVIYPLGIRAFDRKRLATSLATLGDLGDHKGGEHGHHRSLFVVGACFSHVIIPPTQYQITHCNAHLSEYVYMCSCQRT